MALVNCPDCGKMNVSDTAEHCPECGYAIKKHFEREKEKAYYQKKEEEEMQQIMDLYREWFQKNEITEEEVQEWKRGVSNRKETME